MNNSQTAVYEVLKEYGPLADHALVPIMQHEALIHQSSSGIRTRRKELTDAGLVRPVGAVTMPSGREALIWSAA